MQNLDEHEDKQKPVDDPEEAAYLRPFYRALPRQRRRACQGQEGGQAEKDPDADGKRALDVLEQPGGLALRPLDVFTLVRSPRNVCHSTAPSARLRPSTP